METLDAWIRARPLEPQDAIGWVVRVARAVEPMHELGVPHGRITAEAVRCSAPGANARALLLDADEVPRDYQFYSARRCRLSGASKEDDVWALGVLLYFAVTGAPPFEGSGRRQVRERIDWRPASPLSVYEVDHQGLQMVLDRVFKPDETLRLVTIRTLIDTLIALHPVADELPPLEFGVPHGDDLRLDLKTWARTGGRGEPQPRRRSKQPPRTARVSEPQVAPPIRPLQLTNLVDDPLSELDDPELAGSQPASPEPDPPVKRAGTPPAKAAPATEPEPSPPAIASRSESAPARAERAAEGAGGAAATGAEPAHGVVAVPTMPPPRPHRWTLLMVAALVAAGAAAALRVLPGRTSRDTSTPSASAPPQAPAPPASAPAGSAPPPSTVAPASGGASTAAPRTLSECVMDLFEPGTFEGTMPPRFDFLCYERDPRKMADALKTEVVLGKGERPVTPAMRMIAELGWYEMALASAARARCCTKPPAMKSAVGGAPCDYDVALAALGEAAVNGDDPTFRQAMARYSKAVHCLVGMGSARAYGRPGSPGSSEASSFVRAMTFVRAMRQAEGGR